eukprot:c8953_g1_i1.p1 GENE.c8953_g1_i1~~c8953_g1_i1.p1  ORF type:complete len:608 (+),score=152.74 c8953_g1_i1:2-1825(+)
MGIPHTSLPNGRENSWGMSYLSEETRRKLSLVHDGSTLDIQNTQTLIQNFRRKDLIVWLAGLFPNKKFPTNNIDEFLALISDGTLLCDLANVIRPESVTCPFSNPNNVSEKQQNIQTFLDFCLQLGLHPSQLFEASTLAMENPSSSDIVQTEPRITHALLIVGVISNEIGSAPVKLQVIDTVEFEEKDRLSKTARSARSAAAMAAQGTIGTMDAFPKKLMIQKVPKDRIVRFSLSNHGSQAKLSGADQLTAEQLAELGALGALAAPVSPSNGPSPNSLAIPEASFGESLSLPIIHGIQSASDQAKRHLSKIPPLLDRHRSMGLAGGHSPILQLNIAALAEDVKETDITIKLTKQPEFATGDFVLVEDELMEVKGIMKEVVMVLRGAHKTQASVHRKGTTVTHVLKDYEDAGEGNASYQILRHRALEEDFDDLDEMDFLELLEESGTTVRRSSFSHGNSISTATTFVYFVSEKYDKSRNSDAKGNHNDDRLLAYLINRLEILVQNRYSIIYFHSSTENHQLDFSFLSKAFGVLSHNFKNNLDNLWIIHPTLWVKMAFFVCSPFMDEAMSAKVFVCETLDDLYEDFEKDGLPLPAVVVKTDQKRRTQWF